MKHNCIENLQMHRRLRIDEPRVIANWELWVVINKLHPSGYEFTSEPRFTGENLRFLLPPYSSLNTMWFPKFYKCKQQPQRINLSSFSKLQFTIAKDWIKTAINIFYYFTYIPNYHAAYIENLMQYCRFSRPIEAFCTIFNTCYCVFGF